MKLDINSCIILLEYVRKYIILTAMCDTSFIVSSLCALLTASCERQARAEVGYIRLAIWRQSLSVMRTSTTCMLLFAAALIYEPRVQSSHIPWWNIKLAQEQGWGSWKYSCITKKDFILKESVCYTNAW